jgi:oligopeptide/dipeptide ABC transporter ATP-binding protein
VSSKVATQGGALLEVRGLGVSYVQHARLGARARRRVRAVEGLSLQLRAGETLALVGESGSGKSSAVHAILRLVAADAGSVLWRARDGGVVDLLAIPERALRGLRPDLGLVSQDPLASLNPRRRVFSTLAEPLVWHGRARGAALEARVAGLLEQVGLGSDLGRRFPHELSGGQRQRVALARALALEPRLLVCDEIVSALDVSVQAQVLELLGRLQRSLGLSLLFVSHDLGVVRHMADRVAVLYDGRLVESGPTESVLGAPAHPYTRLLVDSIPKLDRRGPPEPNAAHWAPPAQSGCAFHSRCTLVEARCRTEVPLLRALAADAGPGPRAAACHLFPADSGSGRP